MADVDILSAAVVASAAAVRPKNPNKVRKRAPKACLSCRARKVRCDVSQRGRPCMNCYLDSETCVVTGRASRLRKTQRPGTTAPASADMTAAGDTDADNAAAAPNSPSNDTDYPAPLPDSFVVGEEINTDHVASAEPAEHSHWHGQEHSHAAHEHNHEHSHDHGHDHSHSHGHAHAPSHPFSHISQHQSPAPDAASSSRHRTASVHDSPQHGAASVHSFDGMPRTTEHQQGGARYSQTPQPSQPSQPSPAQQHQQHAQPAHTHGYSETAPPPQPQPQQQQQQQNHHSYTNAYTKQQPNYGNNNSNDNQNAAKNFMNGAGVGAGASRLGSMPWTGPEQGLNKSADITYSYYPFLAINNLSGILPQDVNYLELQGCLRVPTRSILDEFVQQYFLHVHPLLPLFNEGDFWEEYCQQGAGSVAPASRMSLLVFQAMLFASCNFVSRNSICALGFPTIRAARATFYRRAKLLYDFETELSHAANAQAAVLLTFWSPIGNAGTKNPNTAWLCTAIHQARLAEAHHYRAMPTGAGAAATATPPQTTTTMSAATATIPGPGSNDPARRANVLKRLWWCCIIRDRVIGLGVRRSIQITRAHFDLEANPPLTRADLADEIARSRVYNPGTKSCLIEILVHLVELCVVLTDILTLVFPQDDTPGWGRGASRDDAGRVRQCKLELRRWYKDVSLKFPMFGGSRSGPGGAGGGGGGHSGSSGSGSSHGGSPGTGSPSVSGGTGAAGGGVARVNSGREYVHDSVILYTNLMYMYYHSSRVALCHHEVLQIAVINAAGASSVPIIYENRHELQDAASGVTECLKELIQLRLARWLPISAVACTALPLFLHILDVKLSQPPRSAMNGTDGSAGAPSPISGSASSALKQHRLNILIEAMKTYQPQYDGVDWVSELIRHSVNLTQLDGPTGRDGRNGPGSGGGGDSNISDWTDILATNPSLYLRLALTVDLALSKSRLPEERDFPVGLRGLFSNGFAPGGRQLGYDRAAGGGANGMANGSGPVHGNNGQNNHQNQGHANGGTYGNGMGAPGQTPTPGFQAQANEYTSGTASTMPTMLGGSSSSPQQPNGGLSMPTPSTTAGGALPPDVVDYSPEYAATAATALAGGAPFMLAPHHLAMSMSVVMGMGMGVDVDPAGMDLVDMDMDMSMAFPMSDGPSAAATPGAVAVAAAAAAGAGTNIGSTTMPMPGTVTQLPSSDEETTSPGPTDSVSPASLSVVSGPSDAGTSPAAAAVTTTTNPDKSKEANSNSNSAVPRDGDEWMQQGWGAEEEMREGDRDTARALLEAMNEAS